MRKTRAVVVSVPQPCSADWEAMMPAAGGRYCTACRKTVTDFTAWDDEALAAFFQKPENASACGRFRTAQLNRPLRLPHQPHSLLYRWVLAAGLAAITLTAVPAAAQTGHSPAPLAPVQAMAGAAAPIPDSARTPLSAQEIEKLPVRNLAELAAPTTGPYRSRGESLNVGGGRAENVVIIVDDALLPLRPQPPAPPARPEPHGTQTLSGEELDQIHLRDVEDLPAIR